MVATKEKFPTRGDTVSLEYEEKRMGHGGKPLDPVMYEVVVLVTAIYPEESLLIGVEMERFCYVKGFKFKGKRLPVENPYGSPKTNGYWLSADGWRVVQNPSKE